MARGALGLVSLLVCGAIVAYLWAMHTSTVSRAGKQATQQATQLSGHGEDGKSALESIKTQPENDASGHFKSLIVTEVVPGGAMDKFYAFKKGDRIITEGQYEVTTNGDADTASAMLLDAFEKFQPVVVMRDSKQVTLGTQGAAQLQQLQNLLPKSGN